MKRWLLGPALALCAVWLATCETAPPPLPDDHGPRTRLIQVASNGWHTAIVVPAPALVATGLLPEAADFPDAAFLEFGWGDRVYYPAKEKTLGMTLAAALVPTPAVMHMAGLEARPENRGGTWRDVVAVALTDKGFLNLVAALAAEFERPAGGRAKPVARGLYPGSHFYNALGEFHLFNTCNTWTARMLRAGGVAISPSGIVTADGLMARLRTALAVE